MKWIDDFRLARQLKSEDPQARDKSIVELAKSPTPKALEMIRHTAEHDANEEVRNNAVFALINLKDTASADVLARILLNDKHYKVKTIAVIGLATFANKTTIGALVKAFDWDNTRSIAAKGLVNIGGEAVPALTALLTSERPYIRAEAACAIGKIGDTASISHLVRLLRDEDEEVRFTSLAALGNMGWQPTSIEQRGWKHYARDSYSGVDALTLETNTMVMPLLDILESMVEPKGKTYSHLRFQLVKAIKTIDRSGSVLQVEADLRSDKKEVRSEAISTIRSGLKETLRHDLAEYKNDSLVDHARNSHRPHPAIEKSTPVVRYRSVKVFEGVTCIEFLPGAERIMTAGNDASIWDINNGKETACLKAQSGQYFSTTTLANDNTRTDIGIGYGSIIPALRVGAFIVVGEKAANRLLIWDLESSSPERFLEGHSHKPLAICASLSSSLLGSVSDSEIILWDIASDKEVFNAPLNRCPSVFHAMTFIKGDSLIVLGSQEGDITILSSDDGKEVITARVAPGPIRKIACVSDDILLVADHGGGIRLLETSNLSEQARFEAHFMEVNDLKVSANQEYVISAGDDTARIWELKSQSELYSLPSLADYKYSSGYANVVLGNYISAVAISPDSSILACGLKGEVAIYKLPEAVVNQLKR